MKKENSIPTSRNERGVVIEWSAILIAAFWATWLSAVEYFSGDAIGYKFIMSPESDGYTTEYVSSLSDIWQSQVNHWHTVNGRFVCHFIVQIFCGITPQWIWAIVNGIVWGFLVWICGRAGDIVPGKNRDKKVWIGLALLMLVLPRLFFCPPLQVNYVWGYAIEIAFVYLFFRRQPINCKGWKAILVYVSWVILALSAGEWNEAFSVPISVGLICFFIIRRGRLRLWEWVGILAYGAGGLILCLAPGNFVRLEDVSGDPFELTGYMKKILFSLLLPAVGVGAVWILFGFKKVGKIITERSLHEYIVFLCAVVIGSYVFGFALEFSSGNRVIAAVGLVSVLFVELMANKEKPKLSGMSILLALCFGTALTRTEKLLDSNRRYALYDELYYQSSDGRVYVPGYELEKDWRTDQFISFFVTYDRKASDKSAPAFKLLPDRARELPDSDYNAIIPLSQRAYLFVRSRKHPARFLLRRRVGLPGTPLTIPVSDRELNFDSPKNDITLDTLSNVWIGLYINEGAVVEAEPYIEEK